MKTFFSLSFFLLIMTTNAQNLPYHDIPEPAKEYTAGAVVSRMIDGLGFRYYWATEGLTDKDLKYKPSAEARTTSETLAHITSLSQVILNTALQQPNTREDYSKLSFKEQRKRTLLNLKKASDLLKNADLSKHKIIFGKNEFPFWNNINGPIADALWHSGQIVSFRRASGNPLPKGVNVFLGKKF